MTCGKLQPINYFDNKNKKVIQTNTKKTAGSEVVVLTTSGVPRTKGMSRDDLISINAGIVKAVINNVIKYSPLAKIIVVLNPLDVMNLCLPTWQPVNRGTIVMGYGRNP